MYVSEVTIKNEESLKKFALFLENLQSYFLKSKEILSSSDDSDIDEFFDFYKEEIPEVFGQTPPVTLTKKQLVKLLRLKGIATHGAGADQQFVLDFTLGYDQLLCVKYDANLQFSNIAWES